jgi:mannosyl-oligosaccharide alpha-1,2-mannosidase
MAFLRRTRVVALITIFIITTVYLLMTSSVRFQSNNPTKPSSVFENLPDANSHWAKLADNYPVASHIPLPTGALPKIPKIQATPSTEDAAQKTERLRRLSAVKESFEHSWEGYKKNAWLRDEVVPVAGGYRDTFGGWAATLVDALDTLWIMGMKEEFQIAVAAVQKIDFTTTTEKRINVFETNIRYLGGFLAAYDISDGQAGGYDILLVKAVEVGELLMSVFDTPNRMPISRWDWQS